MKRAAWRVGAVSAILGLAYVTAGMTSHWFADTFLVIEPPREVARAAGPALVEGDPERDEPVAVAPTTPRTRERANKRRRPSMERAEPPATKQPRRQRRCVRVSRREVRARVLDPGSLRRVRIAVQDEGIALTRIGGTPLTRLGFREGDVVTRIQGGAATVDAALALLAAVDRVSEIRATVLRGTRRVGLCAVLTDEITDASAELTDE